MKNEPNEVEYGTSIAKPVFAALLIGGLAGAGAMFLLAPRSGKETRVRLQQKSIELRDRTTESVDEAVAQIKFRTREITADVRGKAEELQQQGQELLAKQLEQVAAAAETGKATVRSY